MRTKRTSDVIGVDEVGRGALSGPIVAAAIRVMDVRNFPYALAADSKMLTDKKRRELLPHIQASCEIHYGVVSSEDIDRIGIQGANVRAIEEALVGFSDLHKRIIRCDYVAAFARYTTLKFRVRCYIRGESRYPEIAAASVAAKVYRDDLMIKFETQYPGYGFAQHKGYGTRAHKIALGAAGMSPIHRRSFSFSQ